MDKNLKILIADDSASFGRECSSILKSDGFDVVLTKKDGARVNALIDSQHFDVVLMDVFMAHTDAIGVMEHINQSLAEKPLIVLISGVDNPEFEEQLIKAGADYYFLKPVEPDAVASRIKRISSWQYEKKSRKSSAHSEGTELTKRRYNLLLIDFSDSLL